jgi:uncharacterized protein
MSVLYGPYSISFHSEGNPNSPSSILSKYIGYPVHLAYKGPTRRMVKATKTHPDLPRTTSAKFQDGYPFLVTSVESLLEVQDVVQDLVKDKNNGLNSEWKSKDVVMERSIHSVDITVRNLKKKCVTRFRPNIVLKGSGKPFIEDEYQDLGIENHQFSLVSKCARCMVGVMHLTSPLLRNCQFPNIDPSTGVMDKSVPSAVSLLVFHLKYVTRIYIQALTKFRKSLDPDQKSAVLFGCNATTFASGVLRVGDTVYALDG